MTTGMEVPKPSFKGLKSGGEWRTPLKKFRGRLKSITPKAEKFGTMVHFGSTEVQVILSDTPYLYPIADISIKYSEQENSGWGKLGDSYAKAMGCSRDEVDLGKAVGKLQTWERKDNYLFGTRSSEVTDPNTGEKSTVKEEMKGTVWEVSDIEGMVSSLIPGAVPKSLLDTVIGLMDGRNQNAWWRAALTNEDVKKDAKLQDSIMNNTLLEGLKAAGTVMEDENGILHIQDAPF
mgnify:CR=1 FL=1